MGGNGEEVGRGIGERFGIGKMWFEKGEWRGRIMEESRERDERV